MFMVKRLLTIQSNPESLPPPDYFVAVARPDPNEIFYHGIFVERAGPRYYNVTVYDALSEVTEETLGVKAYAELPIGITA